MTTKLSPPRFGAPTALQLPDGGRRAPGASLLPAAIAALCLVLASCVTRGPANPPTPEDSREASAKALARAEAIARSGSATGEELALSGWMVWMHAGDSGEAIKRFERALEIDPRAPLAHFGLARVAFVRLDEGTAARHYLSIIENAPGHPLAEVSASSLTWLLGSERELDERALSVLRGVARSDDAGPGLREQVRDLIADRLKGRGNDSGYVATVSSGAPAEWTVAGPFSRFSSLEPEAGIRILSSGVIEERFEGPLGELEPWTVMASEGSFDILSPREGGDVYYAAVDLTVPEEGTYYFSWRSSSHLRVVLSGVEVLARDAFGSVAPSRGLKKLGLAAGEHRLVVRISGWGGFKSDLAFLDEAGRPVDLAFSAASGNPPPTWRTPAEAEGQSSRRSWRSSQVEPAPVVLLDEGPGLLERLREIYERDPTKALASFIAAQHLRAFDQEALKPLLEHVLFAAPDFSDGYYLAALLAYANTSLPRDLRMGRAGSAANKAAALDPIHAASRHMAASIAIEQNRFEEAGDLLDQSAEIAHPSVDLALERAKLYSARGQSVLARNVMEEALAYRPSHCRLLHAVYRARSDDLDMVGADLAAAELAECGLYGRYSLADHLAGRGERGEAIAQLKEMTRALPTRRAERYRLTELLVADGRIEEAREELESMLTLWSRSADLLVRLAEVSAMAGDDQAAAELRRRALALNPSDGHLRRALAYQEGGELLDWAALDLEAAIVEYQANEDRRRWGSDAVLVVDHAGLEVFVDDPARPVVVERIQMVTEVLTKQGLDHHGEFALPPRAEIIALHTRKQDGRLFDPEISPHKDTITLAGLEVGDFVVADYLVYTPARSSAMPGWAGSPFYMQVFGTPLHAVSYVARAPLSAGLKVEARNLRVSEPVEEGGFLVFRYSAPEVPVVLSEHDSPGADEILPWVRVGAGARPESYGDAWGDFVVPLTRVTHEVTGFTESILSSLPPETLDDRRALTLALVATVNAHVLGRSPSAQLSEQASHVIAKGRGNRLLATRAVLAAAGIDSRIALVRPFDADPGERRFPAGDLYRYAVLRVELDDGEPPLWIDQNIRTAPIGTLRPVHAGRRAILLAEPGAPTEQVVTPEVPRDQESRRSALELKIDVDGNLMAGGVDTYTGFWASMVRAGMEHADDERRRQAVESSLAQVFGPIRLRSLVFEGTDSGTLPGAPMVVRYDFEVEGWARTREGIIEVPGGTLFPALISRRLVRLSERQQPMLLQDEAARLLEATFELPEGYSLTQAVPPMDLLSKAGRFQRDVESEAGRLVVRERLELELQRIPPSEYPDLVEFAAAVDRAQAAGFAFEKTATEEQ